MIAESAHIPAYKSFPEDYTVTAIFDACEEKAMALADGRAKEHIAPILKQVELTVEEYKQFLEAYPDAEVGTHTVNIVRQ